MMLRLRHASLWVTGVLFISLSFAQGSGDCLDFDGTNDHVHVTENQPYAGAGGEFTVECWIKSSDGTGTNMAFVTNYGGTGQTPFFMLGFDGSNAFFWCRDGSGTSTKPTTPRGNVVDGTWHHFAGVRSNSGTFLYLDGVLVGSAAAMTNAVNFGTTLSIMDHYNRFTSGQIDEIRIWSEARNQDDIRNNMCKTLAGTETNLYGYWDMDGATTGAGGVTDLSTSGNDGTMINMVAGDVVTSGAAVGDDDIWVYPADWGDGALDFDGTNDRVVITDNAALDIQDELTIEFWFRMDGNSGDNNYPRPVSKGQTTTSDGAYGVFVQDPSSPTFIGLRFMDLGGGQHDISSSSVPNYNDGNWHHVAATYSNSQDEGVLYVDGTIESTTTINGNTQIRTTTDDLYIGGTIGSNNRHWNGAVDEVRIWNRALSEGEILNNMCRSLAGNESGLAGYWKLNDGSGTTALDETTNNNDGTLTNMAPASDWISSGVTCSWAGLDLTLESFENDSLSVSSVTGTPDGVHIYHVQQLPNTLTGTNGVNGSNDHYYGVFKTGGAAPTYTATYFYSDNDAYLASDPSIVETDLRMYKRDDNADATWVNSGGAVNTTAKTITAAGQSTEYILGILGGSPLPIELLSFDATLNEYAVDLSWTTATEINNDFFTVERSVDGEQFEPILKQEGAGNSHAILKYADVDPEPAQGWNFYRLKQTDFDGSFTYSDIASVYTDGLEGSDIILYPNPNSGDQTTMTLSNIDEPGEITVFDISGKKVLVQPIQSERSTVILKHEGLEKGVYLVSLKLSDRIITKRLIID